MSVGLFVLYRTFRSLGCFVRRTTCRIGCFVRMTFCLCTHKGAEAAVPGSNNLTLK